MHVVFESIFEITVQKFKSVRPETPVKTELSTKSR